ncbi:cupin domain-containing protein [Actinoplanes sp. NPDC051851]|uniref:cupin domain-containing protein n=1 Tax=Actinoplanes sp. NPDC051851 TaxID=3154753 RepID=UPI003422667E
MAIHRHGEAVAHRLHGAAFHAYVNPSAGSEELCAWRLEIGPGTRGTLHRVGREEVILLLAGRVTAETDGVTGELAPGDVLRVPGGAEFAIHNDGAETAEAWVTTSVGFEATLPDGSTIAPPWTR